MSFKIKDLMISVLPAAGQDCGLVTVCTFPSVDVCTGTDTRPHPPRHGCTGFTYFAGCGATDITVTLRTCFYTFCAATLCAATDTNFDSPPTSLAALAALKEQLKQQLAAVEKQQAAVEESLRPSTIEEVDLLTKKLNEALVELKKRRAELSRKPKPARNK
jgi:hypothetical protein